MHKYKNQLFMRYVVTLIIFSILFANGLFSQEAILKNVKEPFIDPVGDPATFQGQDITYFLSNFVMPRIQYPDSAKINCIQGKVFILFAVDSIGQIKDTKVIRSLNRLCDEEAIRVIKLSTGMWTPAKLKGKNVKQIFSLPISFILPKPDCRD